MPPDLDAIRRLDVPLIVVIDEREMLVSELLALSPGSIIEFPKTAEGELVVMINDRPIGSGRAVKIGENFGVRIEEIGDRRDRLDAAIVSGGSAPPRGTAALSGTAMAEQMIGGH